MLSQQQKNKQKIVTSIRSRAAWSLVFTFERKMLCRPSRVKLSLLTYDKAGHSQSSGKPRVLIKKYKATKGNILEDLLENKHFSLGIK